MKAVLSYFGWFALALGLLAAFVYSIVPNQTIAVLSLAGVALILTLVYCASDWENIQKVLTGRTAIHGANALTLTLVFLGILIFINLLTSKHNHRFDLTKSGLFTLSPQTKQIVSELPRKVKITAFFQTQSPDRTKFQNLIDGYLPLTDQLELAFVDPDKNPAITKQFGIKTYGTLALESGKNETKITSPNEENLTNGIRKVIQDKKKKIYFLQGHGERSIEKTDKDSFTIVKTALEKDGHEVMGLLLLQLGNIPDDADLLIINGPVKPLLKEELRIIDNYLEKGGSVFLMVDPQTQIGMDSFLSKWGIELGDDLVIDPLSKLFGGDTAAPVIGEFADHEITKDFSLNTIMPLLRSVAARPHDKLKTVELMKTQANSWAEKNYKDAKIQFDSGIDSPGPIIVGVVSTLEVLKPEEKEIQGSSKPTNETKPTKNKQARLVVIGDADFASNNYFNFSGNGDFFLNVASWLVQEEMLISIRPKKRQNTPVQLTQVQGNLIFMSTVIGFPMIVLVFGFRIWWNRRAL